MEKTTLKTVLTALTAGALITLNFRSDKASLSGEYSLVGTKKGRGKGGSLLAELKSTTSGDLLSIGTPSSDDLVNITVDGVTHGFESESQIPVVYETNAALASQLKEQFKSFVASEESPLRVQVVAPTAPDLNGTFNVISVVQLRGRGGQMVLKTVEGTEIWSYRHSGVIESVSVVGAEALVAATELADEIVESTVESRDDEVSDSDTTSIDDALESI